MVANDPAAPSWFPDARVIADDEPGLGPLGGIATALAAANGLDIVVVAWDMPFVPAALLAELRRRSEGADAVVPVHDGKREPLCAWYSGEALPLCRALLASGERRASALAEALPRVRWMDARELESLGDPEYILASVDTPERLAALGGAHP